MVLFRVSSLAARKIAPALWVWFGMGVLGCLALAVAGVFAPLNAGVLAVALLPVAIWLSPATGSEPRWFHGAAWSMALGSLFFTLPPGELIPGGWDPGVYLQTASQISRQGTLLFEHPDLLAVPETWREILFRDVHTIPEPFGGMRIFEGRITPQFYHAYPSLLALGISDGEIRPALWVNPMLNVLSILLMIRLVLAWTGRRDWALIGGLMLLWFPTQIWQAKFSTAELLTQVWILVGFLQWVRWGDRPESNGRRAFAAGLAFGLAFLTRYDSIMMWMVLVPVLGFLSADPRYRRGVGLMILGALPSVVIWIFHQRIAPYYQPFGSMVRPMAGISAVLSGAAFWGARYAPWKVLWKRGRVPLLSAVTIAWVLWTGFAWWVRPGLADDHPLSGLLIRLGMESVAEVLTGPSQVAMLYLESLFTPVGLFLVLAAAPMLWWRARTPGRMAWALCGAAVTLVLTWNPMNDLFMMWVSRRFVPLTIPWLISALGVGACAVEECLGRVDRIPRGRVRNACAALCACILMLQAPASWFQARNREWPGALEWFESVAASVPDGAALFTDQPGFGSPLRFHWGKHAYELRRRNTPLLRRLLELIRESPPEGGAYFLTTSPLLCPHRDWERVRAFPMRSSMQIQPRTRMPDALKSRGGDFMLYRYSPES